MYVRGAASLVNFVLSDILRLFGLFSKRWPECISAWKSLLTYFTFGSAWAGVRVKCEWSGNSRAVQSCLSILVMEELGRKAGRGWGGWWMRPKVRKSVAIKRICLSMHHVIRVWSSSATGSCWDWELNKIKKEMGQMIMSTDFSKYLYKLIPLKTNWLFGLIPKSEAYVWLATRRKLDVFLHILLAHEILSETWRSVGLI